MERYRLLIVYLFVALSLILLSESVTASETLNRLKDETLSYFKPLKGRVISSDGEMIMSDLGEDSGIKKGMRLNIIREGVPLLHPVTKEQIGRVEVPSGRAEIVDVTPYGSKLRIINGSGETGNILRLSEIKIRALFYQDRSVPWGIGEAFYQLLKQSERFELVDSSLSLQAFDEKALLEEAKKNRTTIIIAIKSSAGDKEAILKEMVLWTDDGERLMEAEVPIDASMMKESQFGDLAPIGLGSKEALLFFDLPYSGRLITTGNFDGKDKDEIAISNGKVIRIYRPGISLYQLYEIDVPVAREHLWLDRIDLNGDGKDEIVLTTLGDDEVLSYVYEMAGDGFGIVWKERVFLRVFDGSLIAQGYSGTEGFTGPVYTINYSNGRFIKGEDIKLLPGINIYDFTFLRGAGGEKYILTYDDKGYLALYDTDDLRLWMSRDDTGGFVNTFKKTAPTIMVDRGEWSVKDRIFASGNRAFFVKRLPLVDMARSLGVKRSEIRLLWWTGLTMEGIVFTDTISGSIMDYAISGDRLYVISKPFFGIKTKNILKGENPLGSMLYIYSLKGF